MNKIHEKRLWFRVRENKLYSKMSSREKLIYSLAMSKSEVKQ